MGLWKVCWFDSKAPIRNLFSQCKLGLYYKANNNCWHTWENLPVVSSWPSTLPSGGALCSSCLEILVFTNFMVRMTLIGLWHTLRNPYLKLSKNQVTTPHHRLNQIAGDQAISLSMIQKHQLSAQAGYHCLLELFNRHTLYVYSWSMVRNPYLCLNLEASGRHIFKRTPWW
jgi:hypothetical protein